MLEENLYGLHQRKVWSIGGGKGGTGKSMIACNIAIILARLNHKVLLVDADLGGANIHTTLGMGMPEATLSDFLKRRTENLHDVIVETSIPNLSLISGAQDFLDIANPKHEQKLRLLRHLSKIEFDHIILDLGAGTSFNVLDFFLFSDEGILVVMPEPTSIENAYRFIKSAFYRKFRQIVEGQAIKDLVDEAKDQKNSLGIHTPCDLIKHIRRVNQEAGETLAREMIKFKPKLVMNQVRTKEDVQIGFSMKSASRVYFGINLEYPGYVEYDDCVWRSVRCRRPLAVEHPQSRTMRYIEMIVHNLLSKKQMEGRDS